MNSIVRNFVFVISRFKMASFLNVAGLSVAFTAFLILFMHPASMKQEGFLWKGIWLILYIKNDYTCTYLKEVTGVMTQ